MKKNKHPINHAPIDINDRIADIKAKLQALEKTSVTTEIDLVRKNAKMFELHYQIENLFVSNESRNLNTSTQSFALKALKTAVKQYNNIKINNWVHTVFCDENGRVKSKSLILCSALQNNIVSLYKLDKNGQVINSQKYIPLTNLDYVYKTYNNQAQYTYATIDNHIIINSSKNSIKSHSPSKIITRGIINIGKKVASFLNRVDGKAFFTESIQDYIEDFTDDLFECDIGMNFSTLNIERMYFLLLDIKDISANQVIDTIWNLIRRKYNQNPEAYNKKIQEVEQREDYNRITSSTTEDQFVALKFNKKVSSDECSILYVHKGMISCQRNRHNIECVTAIIPTATSEESEINVNYCNDCNKYFISYGVYEIYRKKYNSIYIKFRMIESSLIDNFYSDVSSYSPLRLVGYNVSKTSNFSDEYRQNILREVIERGIMRKYEVIDYLDYFIHVHEYNPKSDTALEKWNKDLKFVKMHDFHKQRKVQITEIKRYNSGE